MYLFVPHRSLRAIKTRDSLGGMELNSNYPNPPCMFALMFASWACSYYLTLHDRHTSEFFTGETRMNYSSLQSQTIPVVLELLIRYPSSSSSPPDGYVV